MHHRAYHCTYFQMEWKQLPQALLARARSAGPSDAFYTRLWSAPPPSPPLDVPAKAVRGGRLVAVDEVVFHDLHAVATDGSCFDPRVA